jgi:hypothetical protein
MWSKYHYQELYGGDMYPTNPRQRKQSLIFFTLENTVSGQWQDIEFCPIMLSGCT